MRLTKPLLVFDGDCGFCRKWILRWQDFTGETLTYAPFQEAAPQFPQIPMESFRKSVHFITPQGEVCSGAEAVFRSLAIGGSPWLLFLYRHLPGFHVVSEKAYRLVADHRPLFGFLTNLLWGKTVQRPSYARASRIFLTGLGVVYLVAFLSFWSQAHGLIGSHGILPMPPWPAFRVAPSVFWFSQSDVFLTAVCAMGVVSSLLLIVGWARRIFLFVCWALYLSIVVAGRDFLSFQWDVLLLEAGFLAIFLPRKTRPSRLVVFLFHWLLFRFMLGSALVKWLSGDPSWRNFTALNYHYFTQPLPTWTSWILQQFPSGFQRFSVAVMFGVEAVAPFFIFAPRRLRHWAAWLMIGLQFLIMSSGNYCFFNLISILLCLFLFDDRAWSISSASSALPQEPAWKRWSLRVLATVILISTAVQFTTRMGFGIRWPAFFRAVASGTQPFHSTNSYGLFAVMTTTRPEIIVQGSNDGTTWLDYEFKYKPGDIHRRPVFVEPHQPRLDWQMWFAALGTYQQNPWFVNFCVRLLQGSPDVLKLLKQNPFPSAPPRFVRALVYHYTFTTIKEKRDTGAWWKREEKGIYLPVITLKNEPDPAQL